jgi:hypothetical protein
VRNPANFLGISTVLRQISKARSSERKIAMWKTNDIKDGESYSLLLCERKDGLRFVDLQPLSQPRFVDEVDALETLVVPNELLRKRNLEVIASAVTLRDGTRFCFDAHGVWFTEGEMKAFSEAHWNPAKVRWVNRRVPRFAPK